MLIIVGVAGSGKSTQSKLLAARGNYRWLSVGELLRREITGDDKTAMLAGKMLDDAEVIGYVSAELKRLGDVPEIILDGFPRTVSQANWLFAQGYTLRALIHINASKAVVKERLLQRGRADDHEQAIAERFKEYDETIAPIVADVHGHGVTVIEVNGDQPSEAVQAEIIEKLKTV